MSTAGAGRAGGMASSGDGGPGNMGMRFSCRTCGVGFANAAAHKQHHHSEWHMYNLKRSLHDLPPLSFEQFCKKLQVALLAAKLKEAATRGDRRAVEAAAADAVLETLQQQQVPPSQTQLLQRQQLQGKSSGSAGVEGSSNEGFEAAGRETAGGDASAERWEEGRSREKAAALAATAAALIGLKLKGDGHVKGGGKRGGTRKEAAAVRKAETGGAEVAAASGSVVEEPCTQACSNKAAAAASAAAPPAHSAAEDPAAGAVAEGAGAPGGGEAAAAREFAVQQKPECVSLFDNHPPFKTWQQNLRYMRKVFSFVPPDEEYLTNVPLFFRIIWQQQLRRPRCLLCGRGFATAAAAQQHMQQKGHTQLQWENDPEQQTRLQQKLVAACYDYRQSYVRLLEKRLEANKLRQPQPPESAPLQHHEPEPLSPSAFAEEEAEDSSEWEDATDESEEREEDNAAEAGAAAGSRSATAAGKRRTAAVARTSGLAAENLSQEELEELLVQHGVGPATVTDTGLLRLPDKRLLVNRHVAYIYKQRRRAGRAGTGGIRAAAEALVLEDMQQRHPCAVSRIPVRGRHLRAYAAAMVTRSRKPAFLDMRRCSLGSKPVSYVSSTGRQSEFALYSSLWTCAQQQPATSLAQRKRSTRRQQVSYVSLGVKQNKLQKHMRLEHKCFF